MQNAFLSRLILRADRPLVIAHRGDSAHAPENTLEAARLASLAGADAWELDVQLSRDGVAVVLHDESLVRTTDVALRFAGDARGRQGFHVSDFDWHELEALDAGSWFAAEQGADRGAVAFDTLDGLDESRRRLYRSGAIRVPSLLDALSLTVELDWLVNVEIKSFPESPPGLVEAVLDGIERTGAADRVLLSSFDHRDLVRIAALAGQRHPSLVEIPRGALVAAPLAAPHRYLTELVRAQTYHVSTQCLGAESLAYRRRSSSTSLRGEDLALLKQSGIPVLVYTVNDARAGGLADHLAELGVAGLFTDDPNGVLGRFG
jgi:glycerophosphoryl diester phosphodiesterase